MAISTTFPLFTSFPPEIQALVLSHCPPNDFTCLRLTSRTLYTLSFPLAPSRPISLNNNDIPRLCSEDTAPVLPYPHISRCHDASCAAAEKMGLKVGEKRACRTKAGWRKRHCECFQRQGMLWRRLRGWIINGKGGSGLRYCGECAKFTRRRKIHDYRCYHGRGKPRKTTENLWTHRARKGAFGRKIWRMWVNNKAMNEYEARLRSGRRSQLAQKRYSLRQGMGREVDSSEARDTTRCGWYQGCGHDPWM